MHHCCNLCYITGCPTSRVGDRRSYRSPIRFFHQTTFGQATISHSASWTHFYLFSRFTSEAVFISFSFYSLSRVVLRFCTLRWRLENTPVTFNLPVLFFLPRLWGLMSPRVGAGVKVAVPRHHLNSHHIMVMIDSFLKVAITKCAQSCMPAF